MTVSGVQGMLKLMKNWMVFAVIPAVIFGFCLAFYGLKEERSVKYFSRSRFPADAGNSSMEVTTLETDQIGSGQFFDSVSLVEEDNGWFFWSQTFYVSQDQTVPIIASEFYNQVNLSFVADGVATSGDKPEILISFPGAYIGSDPFLVFPNDFCDFEFTAFQEGSQIRGDFTYQFFNFIGFMPKIWILNRLELIEEGKDPLQLSRSKSLEKLQITCVTI